MICLNRVEAFVLKRISLQLGHQSDPATFLMLIDHEPSAFFSDSSHRQVQLIATVTAQRSQHLSGEALRMKSNQRRTLLAGIAENNRKRGFVAIRCLTLE